MGFGITKSRLGDEANVRISVISILYFTMASIESYLRLIQSRDRNENKQLVLAAVPLVRRERMRKEIKFVKIKVWIFLGINRFSHLLVDLHEFDTNYKSFEIETKRHKAQILSPLPECSSIWCLHVCDFHALQYKNPQDLGMRFLEKLLGGSGWYWNWLKLFFK